MPPAMPHEALSHIRTWVFDLDNTLYPPEARLFDQIEVLMTEYVMQALGVDRDRADYLRGHYWQTHGTTLAGLMREHDLDPTPYLRHVHEIDLSALTPDPDLRRRIEALPGRKVVFTNGSRRHAERVVDARGLTDAFDTLFGIEDANYQPKPDRAAFETVFSAAKIEPATAAMFEDDPRNLRAPHEMGLATVLVGQSKPAIHIHHQTVDLSGFLSGLV